MSEPSEPTPPSSRSSRPFVAACLLLCLVFAAWVGWRVQQSQQTLTRKRQERLAEQEKGVALLVAPVTQTAPLRMVRLPAEIRPMQMTHVFAKVSGYLRDMQVDKGDRVAQGDVLGRVESPETDQQLIDAQSNMRLRDHLVQRLKGLVGGGVVSAQEMDEALAQQKSARAEVARLSALKEYTLLRAPFAGVITARYVDEGALLPAATSSTGSAQPFVELQDMHRVRVWVYLSQSDAPYVKAGDAVTLYLRESTLPPVQASVTRTSGALDDRSRTMLVEVQLDNPDGHFRPGLFCDVEIQLHVPPALQVPSEALLSRGGKTMLVIVADNKAELRPVVAGSDDGRRVVIVQGVQEGEMVGLHVPDDVENASRVRAVPVKRKE